MRIAREDGAPEVSPGLSRRGLIGRGLELRELRYFQSVARTGNFGRAARELNIGQPNVSHQVQKLEQELGTRLLIRHGRGVTLTQAGARLMDRIDRVMHLLDAPLDPGPVPDQAGGTMTLALPREAAPLLVPRLLQACRTRFPGLTIAVREGASAALEEWVLDRQVDLALLQDPPALDELDVEPVVTERLGLVSWVRDVPGAGADQTGPIRVRQLAGLPLILPDPRHWIRRVVEAAAFQRGIALGQVQQADGPSLSKEMVRAGMGFTILPLAAVRDEVSRGCLAFRAIEHDPLVVTHALACHAERAAVPFVADVRRLAHDTMADLARGGGWAGATVPSAAPCRGARQEPEAAIG